MRIQICAVGRIKAADPERALIDDYVLRFNRTGRPLGLGPLSEIEVDDRKGGGMAVEAALLARAVPPGAMLVVLDERGATPSSPDFARDLARWRDGGRQDVTFVIGGADGIDAAFRASADAAMSFGHMVWPHRLVRVMLAEQLYRAATILGGGPYHRV